MSNHRVVHQDHFSTHELLQSGASPLAHFGNAGACESNASAGQLPGRYAGLGAGIVDCQAQSFSRALCSDLFDLDRASYRPAQDAALIADHTFRLGTAAVNREKVSHDLVVPQVLYSGPLPSPDNPEQKAAPRAY